MNVTLWYFMLKCSCFIPTTSEWSDERDLQAAINHMEIPNSSEKGDTNDPVNIDSLNMLSATWLWDD
jgi:hypothetical protein